MNRAGLLYRQVHPTHFENGLSSGAFRPTPRDDDKLSVDCADLTTPKAAFELHKKKTKAGKEGNRVPLETAGTWAFTREDCRVEGLNVAADAIEGQQNQPNNPAHHLVDFSSIPGNPKRKNENVSKRLRLSAEKAGRLWPVT